MTYSKLIKTLLVSLVFVLWYQQPVCAQVSLVLDSDYVQTIQGEISGDASYEHIRFQSQFHRSRGGSNGLWTVAEYFADKAREYGLSDVSLIKQDYSSRPWNARSGDLWMITPEPRRIAGMRQTPLHLADYSRSADVTAELIDIGAGTTADLEDFDVAGKVVLTHGSLGAVMREAVVNRGAAGVVWYPSPYTMESGTSAPGVVHPNQIRWARISPRDDGSTWAFVLTTRQGVELSNTIRRATEPVMVRAKIDAAFDSEQGSEPWQVMVEAFIPGTDPDSGQDIVLTGHMQEEGTSANDDASGCANVLEIARAFFDLYESGRLPRPKRNMRFWWVTEISSQRQYFADNPDEANEMWVNINQDMSGADQSQGIMRKQNVTRLPAARFHFFNDVVESVVEYMVWANTFELAQSQSGIRLYPNPYFSSLGSRQRYNAEVIPFHNNTDHMTFNEAPIGVPGTTFTNMPDQYIHSSDDDLWNVDRTQLGRSAVAVALMAYTMANASEDQAPLFAAESMGAGAARMGENLKLGLSWIAREDDKAGAFLKAVDQIRFAAEREKLALTSLHEIGENLDDLVNPLLEALEGQERQFVSTLETAFRQATGGARLPQWEPNEAEQNLQTIKPAIAAGPGVFLSGRRQLRSSQGLGGLMAHETLNAVDGERTGLDIYKYVAAEAREAGQHYYGVVTAEAVLQYLRNAADIGLITLD